MLEPVFVTSEFIAMSAVKDMFHILCFLSSFFEPAITIMFFEVSLNKGELL